MPRFSARWLAAGLALMTLLPAAPAAASSEHAVFSGTCSSNLTLVAVGPGQQTTDDGRLTVRDIPVVGNANLTLPTGTVLTGAVSGSVTLVVDKAEQRARVRGQITGNAGGGTLTLAFTARVNLADGSVTGDVRTIAASGALAGFEAHGDASGHLLGPLAVQGSGSGPCRLERES